jgi:superfamily II DNA or RNA helicase
VPNITLQYQWKDKIEKMFLEENENINELVSTSTTEIKKINIITYQALTQTGE